MNKLILRKCTQFIYISILLTLLSACSNEDITKPPLKIPQITHLQKNSVIQIPIQIDTKEIQQAIVNEVSNPLSSGTTDKITTDVFTTSTVTSRELIKEYENIQSNWLKPLESTYNYVAKDITKAIDKTFKTGVWIKHKVYLKDLHIVFQGSNIHIFTSYKIDISVDYEQSAIPLGDAVKIKGLLNGVLEADIELMGKVSIDEKAQLHIQAIENKTKVEFTKILLPSAVDILDILKITKTEDFLTDKLLEEPINKYIFNEVENHISKKQVDIQLAKRIQKLVYENSVAVELSKDLWLVPQPNKISVSQITTPNGACSNLLSVNVGVIATPKLVKSSLQPLVQQAKTIPLVCETLEPKIYLYPSLNLKYDFVANIIENELKSLLSQEYTEAKYSISNVKIYPSDTKLVMALDLIEKSDAKKVVTFYLWGTPKLNSHLMNITLEDFDYTIESKNYLVNIANWVLDDKLKNFIHKRTFFSYKKEFENLSDKISTIEYKSETKIITGQINLVGVENIFTSEKSLVVHTLATGDLSYQVNLRK